MIRHFFLDKSNTIVDSSKINMGLNPVIQIGYGEKIMRGLIHFDISEIKQLIEDKTFANLENLKLVLKMTNCFSVDTVPYEKEIVRGLVKSVHRAGSFDLMLLKLPCDFDNGRGFDYISDFWNHDKVSYSEIPSNWFMPKNNSPWPYEATNIDFMNPNLNWADIVRNLKGGIYSKKTIQDEYIKYVNSEPSLIVGSQHFDFGNENLSIDITQYVMDCIFNNEKNYGLCLMFTPNFEQIIEEHQQYVAFFNDNTNTFFHPYVEAIYDDYISDDREFFITESDNRLYLYVSDSGNKINLDNIPTCTINDLNFTVKQSGKGVYYAEIPARSINVEDGVVLCDKWSNIVLNGYSEDDIEIEFDIKPKTSKISIGSSLPLSKNVVPILYGINNDEKITRNEIREISIDFRQEYEKEKRENVTGVEWRLYVKDGNREFDIFEYQPVEKSFEHIFFIINTNDLIPNEYFVDIKSKNNNETKYYRQILKFTIVSNVTKRYE